MNRDKFNNSSKLRLVSDYEVDSEYDSSLEDGECQSPKFNNEIKSSLKLIDNCWKEGFYLEKESEDDEDSRSDKEKSEEYCDRSESEEELTTKNDIRGENEEVLMFKEESEGAERGGLATGLRGGLSGGIATGLRGGIATGLRGGIATGLRGGIATGLSGGLSGGIATGLRGGIATGLSGGIATGLRDGIATGLSGGIATGLRGGIATGLSGGLATGLRDGIATELRDGLATGLRGGIATVLGGDVEGDLIHEEPRFQKERQFKEDTLREANDTRLTFTRIRGRKFTDETRKATIKHDIKTLNENKTSDLRRIESTMDLDKIKDSERKARIDIEVIAMREKRHYVEDRKKYKLESDYKKIRKDDIQLKEKLNIQIESHLNESKISRINEKVDTIIESFKEKFDSEIDKDCFNINEKNINLSEIKDNLTEKVVKRSLDLKEIEMRKYILDRFSLIQNKDGCATEKEIEDELREVKKSKLLKDGNLQETRMDLVNRDIKFRESERILNIINDKSETHYNVQITKDKSILNSFDIEKEKSDKLNKTVRKESVSLKSPNENADKKKKKEEKHLDIEENCRGEESLFRRENKDDRKEYIKYDHRNLTSYKDCADKGWLDKIEKKSNITNIDNKIKVLESLSEDYYNIDDDIINKDTHIIKKSKTNDFTIPNVKLRSKDVGDQVKEIDNDLKYNDSMTIVENIYEIREKEEKLLREKLVRAYNERKRRSSDSDETVYKSSKIVAEENFKETKQHDMEQSYTYKGIVDIYQDEYVSRSKFDSFNSVSDEECVVKVQDEEVAVINVKKDIDTTGIYYPAIQGCRLLSNYEFLNKIEEGTYGEVFRARDKHTLEIVALKRLKMENEKYGFPITSLREVNTLMKAQHENIVTVREVVVGHDIDKIYLVMDFVEHDLKSFMRVLGRQMTIAEVKCLMLQLLAAIAHLHDNWIIHRDIKTSNLLLSHNGILKVADFGLAREYGSPLKSYTNLVVTLWYRAPELLLGQKIYSTHIDMWSVGCIFGEMLLHRAMFAGKSESEQIHILFRELGVPTEEIWPGVSELPIMKKINYKSKEKPRNDKRLATRLSNSGKYVMNKLLTYCPERRFTAEEAKKHYYFSETPLAIHPSQFPKFPAKSETIPKKIVPLPKRIFN